MGQDGRRTYGARHRMHAIPALTGWADVLLVGPLGLGAIGGICRFFLLYSGRMALKRMDNAGIVVDDLGETIDFFRELGLELAGRATIEGEWAGRVTAESPTDQSRQRSRELSEFRSGDR